jgi:hypothetical protein
MHLPWPSHPHRPESSSAGEEVTGIDLETQRLRMRALIEALRLLIEEMRIGVSDEEIEKLKAKVANLSTALSITLAMRDR